jgi:hypothetical protein
MTCFSKTDLLTRKGFTVNPQVLRILSFSKTFLTKKFLKFPWTFFYENLRLWIQVIEICLKPTMLFDMIVETDPILSYKKIKERKKYPVDWIKPLKWPIHYLF